MAMAHPRKLIRLAVVAQLIAAGTAAGARVYADRVDPHKSGATPAVCVYTLNELVDQDSANSRPRELRRDLQLEVVGYVTGLDEETVVDALDDLAEQIETAMDGDRTFGGKASDSVLDDTAMTVLLENGRSSPLVGIVVLTYAVTYRTDLFVTAPVLDDFLRVKATHQVAGGIEGDTTPAVDEFTVQDP